MVYNRALGSKVMFTGAIKNIEIADYIEVANIYISLSSKTSGFELSLLEAMLQKKDCHWFRSQWPLDVYRRW
jgi:glycosyltransferase involved in cell wall biosynthesis